jgi:hypothetical protein
MRLRGFTTETLRTQSEEFLIKKYSELGELSTPIVQNLRSLRKFLGITRLGFRNFSRQDAKNAKSGQNFVLKTFAAFASLREIFRALVAASPRWAFSVKKNLE